MNQISRPCLALDKRVEVFRSRQATDHDDDEWHGRERDSVSNGAARRTPRSRRADFVFVHQSTRLNGGRHENTLVSAVLVG